MNLKSYLISMHFPHKLLEQLKVIFLEDRIGQSKVSKSIHPELRFTIMVNSVRSCVKENLIVTFGSIGLQCVLTRNFYTFLPSFAQYLNQINEH